MGTDKTNTSLWSGQHSRKKCRHSMDETNNSLFKTYPTEKLLFRKGDQLTFIVTDGENVRAYSPTGCEAYSTMGKAIAHLETTGWSIETDNFI